MNIAIYVNNRIADDRLSVENQIKTCTEYAEEHNYQIVKVYIDNYDVSNEKEAYYKMIQDSKSMTFKVVLVYNKDVLGINLYEYILNKKGVEIISTVEEKIEDYSESKFCLYQAVEICTNTLDEMIEKGIIKINEG